jgi:hypothetical protein
MAIGSQVLLAALPPFRRRHRADLLAAARRLRLLHGEAEGRGAVRPVFVKINKQLLRVLAHIVFRDGQAVPWTGELKAAPT